MVNSNFEERQRVDPGLDGNAGTVPIRLSKSSSDVSRGSGRHSWDEQRAPQVTKMSSLFQDPDSIKERVRQSLVKPVYNVQDEYWDTGVAQYIAKSATFEKFILGTIAFNSVWIAIDTDYNDADVLTEAPFIFQFMEHVFCALFFSEIIIRFLSFRRKHAALRDGWFVFDCILVGNMVAETWILTIVLVFVSTDGATGSGVGATSILRVARVLRLSRMARMARLLRAMPELMILIRGLKAAMRSVFFALCLLLVIIFVFAIGFTQLTADLTRVHTAYFDHVSLSMYTLLFRGALLDNSSSLINEIGDESLPLAGVFIMFVLISATTLMNMLIGVLCQVVSSVAAMGNEENALSFFRSKMELLVKELDSDGDEMISRVEFGKLVENPLALQTLEDVGVDPVALVDYADFIFFDDITGQERTDLTINTFMEVVLDLRGSRTATVKDIVDLRKFVGGMFSHFELKLDDLISKRISSVGRFTSSDSMAPVGSIQIRQSGKDVDRKSEAMPMHVDSVKGPPRSSIGSLQIGETDKDIDLKSKEEFLQNIPEGFISELRKDDGLQTDSRMQSLVEGSDTSLEDCFHKLDLVVKDARAENLGVVDLESPVSNAVPSSRPPNVLQGASRGLQRSQSGLRPVSTRRHFLDNVDIDRSFGVRSWASASMVPSLKGMPNHQGFAHHQRTAGESDGLPPASAGHSTEFQSSSLGGY